MIKITQRQLNEKEKKTIQDTKSSQKISISNFLIIISHFFLIPLILGGFIGAILIIIGIPKNFAYGLGLISATFYGIFCFLKERKEDKRLTKMYAKHRRREVAEERVEVINMKINKVCEIDDLEDFGPGYLFSVGSDTFVYAATQLFLDFNESKFPTKELIIEKLPHSKQILHVIPKGRLIKLNKRSISIKNLPIKTDSFSIPLFQCEIFVDKTLMRRMNL